MRRKLSVIAKTIILLNTLNPFGRNEITIIFLLYLSSRRDQIRFLRIESQRQTSSVQTQRYEIK